MSTRTNLITGIAIGSGMMFLLDPQLGTRRRARMRDRAVTWTHATTRAFERAGRAVEAGYRSAEAGSRGLAAAARRFANGAEPISDERLADRLRACIGRHSSHPRAIDVAVKEGCATLSGPILADEMREVLECASAVRGLAAVDNRLEVHARPGSVPELQGAGHRRSPLRWWEVSPTLRVATGAVVAGTVALIAGRKVMS